MAKIKVFISSVMSELEEERAIVERSIEALDLLPNRFEAWPAGPSDPRTRSLDEVRDSEIFVILVGTTVSGPVLAEYEAARETIPDRILAFVKRADRSSGAKEFVERLREECVYKTFRRPKQLERLVQKAIRLLMRDLLRRTEEPTGNLVESSVINETVALDPGEEYVWEFEVEAGDYLSGIVDEVDADFLDVYLMDRGNYVRCRNREQFRYHGDEGVGAHEFESVYVEEDGTWYLVLRNPARKYDREVRVELTRLHLP